MLFTQTLDLNFLLFSLEICEQYPAWRLVLAVRHCPVILVSSRAARRRHSGNAQFGKFRSLRYMSHVILVKEEGAIHWRYPERDSVSTGPLMNGFVVGLLLMERLTRLSSGRSISGLDGWNATASP